jgi:hypothetical protein
MKKILVLSLTISMILLGGCGVETNDVKKAQAEQEQKRSKDMGPMDLPQVTAFQDEKTREFMVSTQEVEPGYYLLEGKSKKFRMLFPENGQYMVRTSDYVNENEEIIGFSGYDVDNNIVFDMQVSYFKGQSFVSKLDVMLDIVSEVNGYNGEFKKEEVGGNEIYSAFKKNIYDNIQRKYNYDYSYFGFVKPIKQSDQGIEYSVAFGCKEEDKDCSLDEKSAREKVNKILQSIKFIGYDKE